MGSFSFEDLQIWQEARKFRIKISDKVKDLPIEEKYRLADQMIRASRSITANIAEGYGRFHYKENMQFCRQARGSIYEMIDHLTVALDEGYITFQDFEYLRNECYTLLKMLNGYIRYLKDKSKLSS